MSEWEHLSWRDALAAIVCIRDAQYAIAAVYGLQLYEWLTGLDKEITLIYHSRWSSVKVAYLLCRYYPIVTWPVIMWAYLKSHSYEFCTHAARPIHILLAPYFFFSQGVMIMRAYAFTGRNWRILSLLGVFYAALFGIDVWAFCSRVVMPPEIFYRFLGPQGCFPDYGSNAMGIRIGCSMLAAILMDLISLVVVIIHCRREYTRGSLAEYFLKQGLGGFVVVLVLNIAAAISFFGPPSYRRGGAGIPLILVVSNLMACRLILQLRRKVNPTETEISRQNSILVELAFKSTKPQDLWLMDIDKDNDRYPGPISSYSNSRTEP